jgi:hypothetical protein
LDRAACVGYRKFRPLNHHDNRQWSLRDIRPGSRHGAQPAERFAVLNDDESPRLSVHATPRQSPRLHNPPDDVWRHILFLVLAHGQHRPHSFKDFHHLPPLAAPGCEL